MTRTTFTLTLKRPMNEWHRYVMTEGLLPETHAAGRDERSMRLEARRRLVGARYHCRAPGGRRIIPVRYYGHFG